MTVTETVISPDDDDVISGFAVVELHPDSAALAQLDFDDSGEPVLPLLRIVCGQFSIRLGPGRNEITGNDLRFADQVSDAATTYRERVRALAEVQSTQAGPHEETR